MAIPLLGDFSRTRSCEILECSAIVTLSSFTKTFIRVCFVVNEKRPWPIDLISLRRYNPHQVMRVLSQPIGHPLSVTKFNKKMYVLQKAGKQKQTGINSLRRHYPHQVIKGIISACCLRHPRKTLSNVWKYFNN